MKGIDVKLGDDTAVCKGQTVQLFASGGDNYTWSPAAGLSNASIPNPKATPQQTTTYTLSVKNNSGCTNAGHITITIRNAETVKAILEAPEFVCRSYDSALFINRSEGKIIKWQWNFGNGITDTIADPPVQYYATGNMIGPYNIKLTITDTAGCTDSVTHLLRIADNCYIAVPTAFTPNGDGLNDYLYPLNAYKATDLLFRVYNRNGQLLFTTRNWNIRWDGTLRGVKQDPGVYIWMLEYNDAAHKRIFLKGTTVLIR
jgi:gliding motility-associated-like protein